MFKVLLACHALLTHALQAETFHREQRLWPQSTILSACVDQPQWHLHRRGHDRSLFSPVRHVCSKDCQTHSLTVGRCKSEKLERLALLWQFGNGFDQCLHWSLDFNTPDDPISLSLEPKLEVNIQMCTSQAFLSEDTEAQSNVRLNVVRKASTTCDTAWDPGRKDAVRVVTFEPPTCSHIGCTRLLS